MGQQNPKHYSPSGIAVYPWLNKPDTKFDPDGVFSVKLKYTKDEVKAMSDVITPLMNGGAHNPIKPELDDQKHPTGNYLVNFKMKHRVRPKNGEEFTQSPLIHDGEGNRTEKKIGGGSRLQICYRAIPFNTMGGGVSLRIESVRVLDLVEFEPKAQWGEEKGSFVASENEKETVAVKEVVDEDEEDF
jgi:hypothetical protein